ncbi:hypothetical protein CDL15_Pgr000674 [Punica granatum]|uniref:Late embryogenesis abundant protein LEA-2 subgroup domain-containing protein n=1 Tax=Punica granatum TaxID=22663 RepID=A0A218W538_PUNGR|nr:hypothetical protein CDL15_Pgr000674 [Punica granatum]
MANEKQFGRAYEPSNTRRAICTAIFVFLLLAGVTALIVYLVYRPEKPRFSVVGAAIYNLNTSTPPLISSTMQFTIMTRNPNRRVSIYYDHLTAYVSYRNQAISPLLALPPLYHERRKTVALSPVLGGTAVPLQVEVANALAVDEAYGVVALRVVVMGRLRYKAGVIRTGHYGMLVRCDVLVGLRRGSVDQLPLIDSRGCKVDM